MKFTVDDGGNQVDNNNLSRAMIGLLALKSKLGSLAKGVEAMKIKWISSENFLIVAYFKDPSGTTGKFESSAFSINGIGELWIENYIIERIMSIGNDVGPLAGTIRQHLEEFSRKHQKFADDAKEMLTTGMTAIV